MSDMQLPTSVFLNKLPGPYPGGIAQRQSV
jgi:hypothetical protein